MKRMTQDRPQLSKALLHPEYGTVLMLLISIVLGTVLSPYFLDFGFLIDSTSMYVEFGIVALCMTLIVISGQIDLSVASSMALVGCVVAIFWEMGLPFGLCLAIGILLGLILGLFNGFIITWFKLPPLIVTIGTLSLYRGISQILLGDRSIGRFPQWFTGIDFVYILGVPAPLLIFFFLFIAAALLLNKTVFGRNIYALGTNEKAARFSGIHVTKMKLILFASSGVISALAGIIMISRLGIARYNLAQGGELEIVTITLLGGTDINGGRGNVFGTFIAFFVLVSLKLGLSVANIKIENQLTIIGFLLIFAIVFSNFIYSRQK
jgi:rhamnose transport system permease protein